MTIIGKQTRMAQAQGLRSLYWSSDCIQSETGPGVNFWNLRIHPHWHTFSSKAITSPTRLYFPILPQKIQFLGPHVQIHEPMGSILLHTTTVTHHWTMNLWEPVSFTPPQQCITEQWAYGSPSHSHHQKNASFNNAFCCLCSAVTHMVLFVMICPSVVIFLNLFLLKIDFHVIYSYDFSSSNSHPSDPRTFLPTQISLLIRRWWDI